MLCDRIFSRDQVFGHPKNVHIYIYVKVTRFKIYNWNFLFINSIVVAFIVETQAHEQATKLAEALADVMSSSGTIPTPLLFSLPLMR